MVGCKCTGKKRRGAVPIANSAAIAERVAKVNVLVETAQDETKAESERVSAIKKLKAEYPDYFGNVSEDISKTGQLTTAKDSLTESLLREARARAAGQKIQELANKTLEIEEKIASKKAEQQEVINQLASKGLTIAQAVAKVEEFTASREKLNSEARTASLFSQDQVIKGLVDRYKELGNESNALTSETFRLTDAQKKLAEVATQGADTITPRVTTQPQLLSQQQQTGTNVINKTTQIEETQFTFSKGLKDFADANKIARQEIEILGNKTKVALQPLEDFKSPLTGFLSEVNGQLDDIRTRFEAVNGSELEIVNAQVDALKAKLKDAAVAFGENSEAVQKLKERIAELEGVQALNIVVEKLKAGFDSLVTESLTAFFDALASGGNALKAFGDAAKQVLKKLIQDLLVAVTRALILATAFSIISGGGAGISLGSAFKFFLGGGKFAEGGIVPPGFPNDTYPALLTSGERVIPAGRPLPGDNGQLTGEIRLSGNDLVVALERFQNNRTRRRGI